MPEESAPRSPEAGDSHTPGGNPRPEAPRPTATAPGVPTAVPLTATESSSAATRPASSQAPQASTPPASTPVARPAAPNAPADSAPVATSPRPVAPAASPTAYVQGTVAKESLKPAPPASPVPGVDLGWVWTEVRKRVFIKVPFSRQVADIMEAAVPIALDEDHFVVGLQPNKYPLSSFLTADQVKNTIEAILQQAAGRRIRFEVIEGTTSEDWQIIKQRRERAQEAVVAMAQQNSQIHHYEDVLNQIAGEIRGRVSATRDRNFPQVRAQLLLHYVPILSDASDMLFPDPEAHEARRILARTIDRVAGFLEIHAMTLAIEIERYRIEHVSKPKRPNNAMPQPANAPNPTQSTRPAPLQPNPAAKRPAPPAAPPVQTAPPTPAAPQRPTPSQVAPPQPAPQSPPTPPAAAQPPVAPSAPVAPIPTTQASSAAPQTSTQRAAEQAAAESPATIEAQADAAPENAAPTSGGENHTNGADVDATDTPRDT